MLAKQRICTNLPTSRDFSCTKYQNPSRSQTLNIFPETKLLGTSCLSLLLRRPRQKAYLTWYLETTDLENSDQRPEKLETSECFKDSDPKKKTIFHRVFAANCNVIKSVCVTQFHSCELIYAKTRMIRNLFFFFHYYDSLGSCKI